jgi:pyruvate dehydrogenase E2 component (dihydrolipoamide acetyltransferase)
MAEFIVMPKMGFDMREGAFNAWRKQIGEAVGKGEVVAEIESDKATLELESQVAGVLLATLVSPGDIVAVGANVAIVGQPGEDVSALGGGNGSSAPKPAAQPTPAASAPVSTPVVVSSAPPAAANQDFPAGVKATPLARKVAREHGVDLLAVPHNGERIRRADVESFVAHGAPEPVAAQPAAAVQQAPAAVVQATPVAVTDTDTVVPASRLRQAIARRMVESKTTIPHFYVTMEMEMGPALELRQQLNQMLDKEGVKISVNDMLVKAAGVALRDFPNINASFAGDKIILHNRINVGSAVATEKGLLTVVQKDTDKSTLSQIARDNKAMIDRSRQGKNQAEDFEGGTFTISNLGVYGVEDFIAIVNPPEAAILAIGGIIEKPVVVNGEIKIGQRLKVTISADHRATDGAEAARFLVRFKELIENPMRLLV